MPSYKQYTALIEADKTRYYRDNLLKLKSGRRNLEATSIEEAIEFCITLTWTSQNQTGKKIVTCAMDLLTNMRYGFTYKHTQRTHSWHIKLL